MSTRTTSTSKPGIFARAFGGAGGVIEPSQKAIFIAVLLGMAVGAIMSKPADTELNKAVAKADSTSLIDAEPVADD